MELDPEIRDFLRESDQMFGPEYAAMAIGDRRRVYNAWAERFSAPVSGVTLSEVEIPAEGGRSIRATLQRPDRRDGPLALIVYYHGGGWVMGSPETHRMATAELARHVGAAVLSVDYRLAPEHAYPAAFDDAYQALLWAARGKIEGIDPRRLAVAGDSAGGNLAAAVSLASRDRNGPRIAAQALIYPFLKATRREAVDHPEAGSEAGMAAYLAAYSGGRDIAADPYAMPLSAANLAGLPSAFIVGAEIDVLREDAEDYASALGAAGVAVECRMAVGLTHSFLRCIHFSRAAYQEFEALCAALRRALGTRAMSATAA